MSKPLPPSRTADQYIVRFPDGMRDRIAEEAKKAGRSMNSEIVARLQASFEAPAQGDSLVRENALLKQANDALSAMAGALAGIVRRVVMLLPAADRQRPEVHLWEEIAHTMQSKDVGAAAVDAAPLLGLKGPEAQLEALERIRVTNPADVRDRYGRS